MLVVGLNPDGSVPIVVKSDCVKLVVLEYRPFRVTVLFILNN